MLDQRAKKGGRARPKKAFAALILMLAMALGTLASDAAPAGVEFKDNGVAVVQGDMLAAPGTPAAALAYASSALGR
jgi:hypothetical protein